MRLGHVAVQGIWAFPLPFSLSAIRANGFRDYPAVNI